MLAKRKIKTERGVDGFGAATRSSVSAIGCTIIPGIEANCPQRISADRVIDHRICPASNLRRSRDSPNSHRREQNDAGARENAAPSRDSGWRKFRSPKSGTTTSSSAFRRPRSAAPTYTFITGTRGRRRRSRCRWSSATNSSASSIRSAARQRFCAGRTRHRRRPHRLRSLPQLPGRAASSLPEHEGHRRESPGGLRRICLDPELKSLALRSEDSARCAFLFRSARQRRAHRAFVRSGRRRCAHHRRGTDRLHGGADRQHGGRAQSRHHRRQSVSARSRAQDGRDARDRCAQRNSERRDARTRNEGRLRRRPRDVGQSESVYRHARRRW